MRISWWIAALAPMLLLRLSPPFPVQHDCGWYLYVAGRVLDGDVLYRDIVEVNPPLVVLLHAIPVWLARVTGLGPVPVFDGCVVAWVAAGLGLTAVVLRILELPAAVRARVVTGGAFVLLVGAGRDFGQREHLMVAAVLPWLTLVQARRQGAAVGARWAVATGVFAGVGCCLKPHFLLVPLVVALAAVRGPAWRRPEHVAALATVVAYAGAVIASPVGDRYLEVVALARQAFGGMDVGLSTFFARPWTLHATVMLGVLAGLHRLRPQLRPALRVFVPAAAGGLLAAVWQCKGWSYHLLPAGLFAWLAVARLLAEARVAPGRWMWPLALWVGTALPLGQHWLRVDPVSGELALETEFTGVPEGLHELRALAPGASVLLLDTALPEWFAWLAARGVRWAGRYPHLWPLPVAIADPRLAQRLRAELVADLGRGPELVMVRDGPPNFVAEPEFDLDAWLRQSAGWERGIAAYRRVRTAAGFAIWLRR